MVGAWRRRGRCEFVIFNRHNTDIAMWMYTCHMYLYVPARSIERAQELTAREQWTPLALKYWLVMSSCTQRDQLLEEMAHSRAGQGKRTMNLEHYLMSESKKVPKE